MTFSPRVLDSCNMWWFFFRVALSQLVKGDIEQSMEFGVSLVVCFFSLIVGIQLLSVRDPSVPGLEFVVFCILFLLDVV